jgi:biofilm PGA synthesis N-glycosyltransferase PgaC
MVLVFWVCLFILFYTFIGYGILLYLLVKIRQAIKGYRISTKELSNLSSITLIVAAYNEEKIIGDKILNTFSLDYPPDKCSYIFITDGSSDDTPEIVSRYRQIKLMHREERKGKVSAIHRAMQEVTSDIVVFTDANTMLNKDALVNIAKHYSDETVGAVAGEKRVSISDNSDATAGEGIYWKYESFLKKLDSELYSVVGAAGELFSIRTKLYQPIKEDTILDDFMISLLIASEKYRVAYEPDAYAVENGSANTKEELKRKVRIAAGGIQSIIRLKKLLNPFLYPVLSFQYISHRVLRWTVTPFCLMAAFVLNIIIVLQNNSEIYTYILLGQTIFYMAAVIGWLFESRQMKLKLFFVPYYFCLMNYAVLKGMARYFSKKQSAAWEKTERKRHTSPTPLS